MNAIFDAAIFDEAVFDTAEKEAPVPSQVFSTKGGSYSRKKKRQDVREDLEQAFAYLTAEPERRVDVQAVIAPYVERWTPASIEIDWSAFERDLVAVQQLLDMYRAELEDEEDVELLLQ